MNTTPEASAEQSETGLLRQRYFLQRGVTIIDVFNRMAELERQRDEAHRALGNVQADNSELRSRLNAYSVTLENACLVMGVPFEPDQPEKTLAKVVEAAIEDHQRNRDHSEP